MHCLVISLFVFLCCSITNGCDDDDDDANIDDDYDDVCSVMFFFVRFVIFNKAMDHETFI